MGVPVQIVIFGASGDLTAQKLVPALASLALKQEPAEGLSEAQIAERVSAKIKMIDPKYYPRLKDSIGLFKVDPVQVENHMLVARALKGEAESLVIKLKPADFADYLLDLARR